jgi:hypothetical protein
MILRWLHNIPFKASATLAGLGLAAWILAAQPAGALNNALQVLIGGGSFGGASPVFTSPGLANLCGADFPSAGAGETAAQIRMPPGTLSQLYVRLQTQNVPSSGSLTVTVRLNGVSTAMSCQLFGSGQCKFTGSTVSVNRAAKLAIQITNDFVGAGNIAFNYSILFN